MAKLKLDAVQMELDGCKWPPLPEFWDHLAALATSRPSITFGSKKLVAINIQVVRKNGWVYIVFEKESDGNARFKRNANGKRVVDKLPAGETSLAINSLLFWEASGKGLLTTYRGGISFIDIRKALESTYRRFAFSRKSELRREATATPKPGKKGKDQPARKVAVPKGRSVVHFGPLFRGQALDEVLKRYSRFSSLRVAVARVETDHIFSKQAADVSSRFEIIHFSATRAVAGKRRLAQNAKAIADGIKQLIGKFGVSKIRAKGVLSGRQETTTIPLGPVFRDTFCSLDLDDYLDDLAAESKIDSTDLYRVIVDEAENWPKLIKS